MGGYVHKGKDQKEFDNPYELSTPWGRDSTGDSYGDRKGDKLREQVTT
jgi:hypothetical protein